MISLMSLISILQESESFVFDNRILIVEKRKILLKRILIGNISEKN